MRIDLDATVRTREGDHAGTVQRAVVDPRTNEVTEFVVSTGRFLGRDVLVPRTEIERSDTDGDSIQLRLSKRELEHLPAYVPTDYVVPPAGTMLPLSAGFPESAYLWPIGLAAASGVGNATTIAPSGVVGGGAPGAMVAGPPAGAEHPWEASLSKDAIVVDRNGDDIGLVDDVLFDQDGGRLRGFVLRVGGMLRTMFGGGETIEVPIAHVEHVANGVIHLRVAKDDLVPAHR
jgi:sporulation protein YlmC with PRC-barrel domain